MPFDLLLLINKRRRQVERIFLTFLEDELEGGVASAITKATTFEGSRAKKTHALEIERSFRYDMSTMRNIETNSLRMPVMRLL